MEREQEHSEDVKGRNVDVLKAVNHHGVDVVAVERVGLEQQEPGIGDSDGEVREVIKNKGENDQAAQGHVTRGESRFHVVPFLVARRAGAAILDRQTDRVENVQEHIHEKKNPDDPEQGAELAQMFRVAVDPVRPEKNLQIPEKMSEDESDQNDASQRDDHLLADR